MSKTLIINDGFEFFQPYAKQKGLEYSSTLQPLPIWKKVIRRIWLKLGFSIVTWFGEWKNTLKDRDMVIVFANQNRHVLDYIRKHNPHVRLIYWYWNPVYRCISPSILSDDLCEKWAFDAVDCKNHGMGYNTTFYLDSITLPIRPISYDVFFSGRDKGRMDAITNVVEEFEKLGLSCFIHIVPDNNAKKVARISYEQTLDYIAQSKAILDFIQEGQMGLTVRTMESLFLNRKLITNNKNIIHEDFYSPENIFILGVDELKDLPAFMETNYVPVAEEIRQKYDITSWLKRFG